tara:strand:+ start:551 stop:997 length:447 start_codon:yes stop_codon:yes gene_type:complete
MTKKELNDIHYGKLKEKFEELGVGGAWKAGAKKSEMINEALKQLAIVKDLKKEDISEDQIQEKLEEKVREIEVQEAEEVKVEAKKVEVAEAEVEAKYREVKFTKEELEKKIALLNHMVNNGTPQQRTHFVHKLEAHEKMLADGHYTKG